MTLPGGRPHNRAAYLLGRGIGHAARALGLEPLAARLARHIIDRWGHRAVTEPPASDVTQCEGRPDARSGVPDASVQNRRSNP